MSFVLDRFENVPYARNGGTSSRRGALRRRVDVYESVNQFPGPAPWQGCTMDQGGADRERRVAIL